MRLSLPKIAFPARGSSGEQPPINVHCALQVAGRRPPWHAATPSGQPATLRQPGRDSRIDVVRGLALLTIYVDHIPRNVLNRFTLHNFSFSDAAEVFVLLAGLSSALAYGKVFERQGTAAGWRQIVRRCTSIYAAQILLFCMTLTGGWLLRRNGYEAPISGPVLDAGLQGFGRGLLMGALPTYLDILPLYLVLLLLFPFIRALSLVSPWLAVAASASIWGAARAWPGLNLPNMLDANGWYFNPFAWQLLFTVGVLSEPLLRELQHPSRWLAPLRIVCCAYLGFGLVETVDWAFWGAPDLRLLALDEPSKALLPPLRLGSVLALAFLAFSSPGLRRLCDRAFMRPIAMCGRHSLEVFATGCALAYASRVLFSLQGTSIMLQISVNLIGLAGMVLVAMVLEQRRLALANRPH